MHVRTLLRRPLATVVALSFATGALPVAAATISRLVPPSELFTSGHAAPVVARFLPGQLFDLQATVQPDPGQTITNFTFFVDGQPVTDRFRPQGLARTSVVSETGDAAVCINADTGKTTGKPGCNCRSMRVSAPWRPSSKPHLSRPGARRACTA